MNNDHIPSSFGRQDMATRKRKPKRRASRAVRLLNVLESYTYASILSQGVAGTTPLGMLTGEEDLMTSSRIIPGSFTSGVGFQYEDVVTGGDKISLRDIITQPGLAIGQMTQNLQANLLPMAVASIGTGIAFRFGKRLLRRPIGNINRNIMKPLLGAGLKL
mgnify:CR=1 FL=1